MIPTAPKPGTARRHNFAHLQLGNLCKPLKGLEVSGKTPQAPRNR